MHQSGVGIRQAGFGERVTYTELRYGFRDTPAAYLVDADGKLVWSGSPKMHEASLRAAAETIAGRAPTELAPEPPKFRAFDKRTGELIWERELPIGPAAAPMIRPGDSDVSTS